MVLDLLNKIINSLIKQNIKASEFGKSIIARIAKYKWMEVNNGNSI